LSHASVLLEVSFAAVVVRRHLAVGALVHYAPSSTLYPEDPGLVDTPSPVKDIKGKNESDNGDGKTSPEDAVTVTVDIACTGNDSDIFGETVVHAFATSLCSF
jgi:hypothetical protein